MTQKSHAVSSGKQLRYGIVFTLISFLVGKQGFTQEVTPAIAPAVAQDAKPVPEIEETIVIIGTRASQQSSIDRKKNATTAIDSIVAEDVGSFPDRNIGEAISRIAGMTLDRGDMGEGVTVAVRGNGPDLTRVEIDGQGVQSGGGAAAAMNNNMADIAGGGGSGARGSEFRDLPSDLIKSVDVVKGSTADMTEGSLGGGIIIHTRTGLDFKKPYIAIRLSAAQGSINKTVQPDVNLIATTKFFDKRLGVLLNVSKSKVTNAGHNQTLTTNNGGAAHNIDFDNSPQKSFTFQPATLPTTDPTVDQPVLKFNLVGAPTGTGVSLTPREIVTRSAAAKTKADCNVAFPAYTPEQLNLISPGTNRTNATNQRGYELTTCLNQWNDYYPNLLRYRVQSDVEDRNAVDLRFDFKVNNNLNVYLKTSSSSRSITNVNEPYNLGGTITATNTVPGSVVVDANHRVTSYSFTDGVENVGINLALINSKSTYFQLGGAYKKNGLAVDFFVGDARSDFSRLDRSTGWGVAYGAGTLAVQPNGLWNYTFPPSSAFDQSNPALYTVLNQPTAVGAVTAKPEFPASPAYTAVQRPQLTNAYGLNFTPRINETEEKTGKLDVSYNLKNKLPFITQIKGGVNLRETSGVGWAQGGAQIKAGNGLNVGTAGYVAPIVLPNNILRSNFVGCQDTPGSLAAGASPCIYGFTPKASINDNRAGTYTFTQAQFQEIIAQTMKPATSQFFGNVPNRGDLLTGWSTIDVAKLFNLVGAQNFNFDCLKKCTANDGNVYDQPHSAFKEKGKSGYVMADFEKNDLPLGMEFTANIGARVVVNEVHGSGFMTFNSIVLKDQINKVISAGTTTYTIAKQVSLQKTNTDLMPAYNYALWVVPSKVVVRYSFAKTVARPPVNRLLPAGTCTYSELKDDLVIDDGVVQDQTCGTIGNPGLKPQTNSNQNLSIEWYPNKDFMFSLATFKHSSKIGGPRIVSKNGANLFEGEDLTDPQTGRKLSDYSFTYNTYENGPGTSRTGWEFASKSAFTFLPWVLKYTGLDFNYSKLRSSDSITEFDLVTGESLRPRGEAAYSFNTSLWYDDGRVNARLAYQFRDTTFTALSGSNNPPNASGAAVRIPYNPSGVVFNAPTAYIDAKISYKFKSGVEIFAEGRNLGLATRLSSSGKYDHFADGTPNVFDYSYSGRRILVGLNYRH